MGFFWPCGIGQILCQLVLRLIMTSVLEESGRIPQEKGKQLTGLLSIMSYNKLIIS